MATVVIIDDDYERATSVSWALIAKGYESSLVPSIDAALDEMCEKWPDVVLLADHLMDWSGQSRGHYRIIYPSLYASQLSEADGLFFLKLGHFLEAKHVAAYGGPNPEGLDEYDNFVKFTKGVFCQNTDPTLDTYQEPPLTEAEFNDFLAKIRSVS